MNQREVISFALQIIEEKDLLAICRKTFTHSNVSVCYAKQKQSLVGKLAGTFIF
jgi:hypothetical protein